MLVIGIDPGTAATGYGLIQEGDDGTLLTIDYGVIVTSAEMPMQDRLAKLHNDLCDLLLLHQPEYSAVEKLFFQRNVRTAISVGQARGVVLLALAQAQLSVAEYAPTEIKQAVTGYGAADKRQVGLMVSKLLNMEDVPKPDDAADALAIAICHLHSARILQIANEY